MPNRVLNREPRRAPPPGLLPALLPALVPALLMAHAPACRAEVTATPVVDLRTTYTDNVNHGAAGQERGQLVAEVAPGLTLRQQSASVSSQLAYQLHLYDYDGSSDGGQQHVQSQLQAKTSARLVDQLLYFDGGASLSQQANSAFGPRADDNGYSTVNRSEVRTYSLSPSVRQRLGQGADLELRYTRDMVDSDNPGFGRSQADNYYAALHSGAAWRALGWSLQLGRQNLDDSVAGASDSEYAAATLRYPISTGLRLTAGAGYDKYDYGGLGGANQGKSWSGGFIWEPTPRSSLQASVGRRYYGASDMLAGQVRSRNTVWSLHYDTAVTTSRSQFLLPTTINTSDLLNSLFAANITDPALRQLAVDNYIKAAGLPPALANSVNYFSNRYLLRRQLQASVAYQLPHTTAVLNLYDTRQTALSSQQVDQGLLGASSSSLNDDTRQSGVSLGLEWRVSPHSGVALGGDYANIRSVSTGLQDHQRWWRLAFSHQFQPRLGGNVELRRARGDGFPGAGPYTENVVSASLTLLL